MNERAVHEFASLRKLIRPREAVRVLQKQLDPECKIVRACRENGIHMSMPRLLCKYPRKLLEYSADLQPIESHAPAAPFVSVSGGYLEPDADGIRLPAFQTSFLATSRARS